MEDRCVSCGTIIPEGQQVCRECMEGGRNKNVGSNRDRTYRLNRGSNMRAVVGKQRRRLDTEGT